MTTGLRVVIFRLQKKQVMQRFDQHDTWLFILLSRGLGEKNEFGGMIPVWCLMSLEKIVIKCLIATGSFFFPLLPCKKKPVSSCEIGSVSFLSHKWQVGHVRWEISHLHGNLRVLTPRPGHVDPQEIAGANFRPYWGKPMVNSPLIRPAISWGVALGGYP